MADTDWNLHSKQLVTPTDDDRMLLEPSDETAKAVEVGGFRNWLMNTALFNTLTTTAKNIIGAIEEVKGIADNNTTQLNAIANNTTLTRGASGTIIPNDLVEIGVLSSDNTNVAEIENNRIKIKKAGLYLIQIYAYTSLKEDEKTLEYSLYNGDSLFDVGGAENSSSFTNTKLNFITMNKFQKDALLNVRLRHNGTNNVDIQSFKVTLYWLRGLDE